MNSIKKMFYGYQLSTKKSQGNEYVAVLMKHLPVHPLTLGIEP